MIDATDDVPAPVVARSHIVKKHLLSILRNLLETFRKYRALYGPYGSNFAALQPGDVKVTRIDSSTVGQVEKYLSSHDYTKHRRRLQDQDNGAVEYFVAWSGDFPVGHLLLVWGGSQDGPLKHMDRNAPFVEDVYVHPAARGKGYAKEMMNAAEHLAAERGYREIGLTVFENNPPVARMYEKRGYCFSDLGVFDTIRVTTDKDGRQKRWKRRGRYMTKRLHPVKDEDEN